MLSTRGLRWLFGVWLVLGGFGATTAAAEGDEVRVTVAAILATTDARGKVDPKLKCIAEEIQKKDASLKGFRLGQTTCLTLKVGQKYTCEVIEGQTVEVTANAVEVTVKTNGEKEKKVSLTVTAPQLKPITYRTCCQKYLPLITPYRTRNKELLIIAVALRPCHEAKK